MTGGLLQLVANSIQDIIFTHSPEITLFKMVYRRYTNFTIDQNILEFSGNCDFNKISTCILRKHGDLLGKSYLRITLPQILMRYKKSQIDRLLTCLCACGINIPKNQIIFNTNDLCSTTNYSSISSIGDILIYLEKILINKTNAKQIKNDLHSQITNLQQSFNKKILEQSLIKEVNKQIEIIKINVNNVFDNEHLTLNSKDKIIIFEKLKNVIIQACCSINNLSDFHKLKVTPFSTTYVNNLIKFTQNSLQMMLANKTFENNQVLGTLDSLKNNIIKCIPSNTKHINVVNNHFKNIINSIPNINTSKYPLEACHEILTKLNIFKSEFNQVEHVVLTIENNIYDEICKMVDLTNKNEQSLLELTSLFINYEHIDNINELHMLTASVLLNKEPTLNKIFLHLINFLKDLTHDNNNNNKLDNMTKLFNRIESSLKKHIFRKIIIDDLCFTDNQILVPNIDIDLFNAHLFGSFNPIPYEKEPNVVKLKLNCFYVDVEFKDISINLNNIICINRLSNPNQIITKLSFDKNNINDMVLFHRLSDLLEVYPNPTIKEFIIFFKHNVIDDSNVIGLFKGNNWNLTKNYFIRYGSDFVEFLNAVTLETILIVRNKTGIETYSNDIELVQYIEKNIYKPIPYFSNENLLKSNIYFLENLKTIGKSRINSIDIQKFYTGKEYVNLEGYLIVEKFLDLNTDLKIDLKKILTTGLKYNFHLYNNIFKLLCADNLVISSTLPKGNEYQTKSIYFHESWTNYFEILNDVGKLDTTFLKNFNLLFNYTQFIFEQVTDRVKLFYSEIIDKHVLKSNHEWNDIQIDKNIYYVNKLYIDFNNILQNRLINCIQYSSSNILKNKIEELHVNITDVLNKIIETDIYNINLDKNHSQFVYTYYTNSNNFSGIIEDNPHTRLEIRNILLYYKNSINLNFDDDTDSVISMLKEIKNLEDYITAKEKSNKYINPLTPHQVINILLHGEQCIKKNKQSINDSQYLSTYDSLDIAKISFLLESELMHKSQFEWFYYMLLDDSFVKRNVGQVITDSIGKIKSNLIRNTSFKYDIVNRFNNNSIDISQYIHCFNECKLKQTIEKTSRLLDRFNENIKIYETEKQWIVNLRNSLIQNTDKHFLRKEIIRNILNDLLCNNDKPTDILYVNPDEYTPIHEIVRWIFSIELNRYTTVEDFFGYKQSKLVQKSINTTLYYTNNHNFIVRRKFDRPSYYYTDPDETGSYLFTGDINILYPITTVVPVLYENGKDIFKYPTLSNTISNGQNTFIELDMGRVVRYNEYLDEYFFIDNGMKVDIQDSDEHGNLLYTNCINNRIIKKIGDNYFYDDTNKLVLEEEPENGHIIIENITEKLNIVERKWILTTKCKKLYVHNGMHIRENEYTYNINLLRPFYLYDAETKYYFPIETDKINPDGSNLWTSGNICLLFNSEHGDIRLDNKGKFISNIIFNGNISKLIPKKSSNNNNKILLLLERSNNIITYSRILEIDTDNSHQFPVPDMIYSPDFKYPVRYLARKIIDNSNSDKIGNMCDIYGRYVYTDPRNGKIVLKYDSKFIKDDTDEDYLYLPTFDNNLKPLLIEQSVNYFNEGDMDGISMTFNQVYPDCVEEYANIFCGIDLTDFDNKIDFIKALINHVIKMSHSADLLNLSTFMKMSCGDIKNNILDQITKKNNVLCKKIESCRALLPGNGSAGKINEILSGSNFSKFAWIRRLGHFLIDEVTLMIGDQTIDKHYGVWINVWYELTKREGLIRGYNKMIGDVPELYKFNNKLKPEYILYIPLYFSFCKESGLFLPLVALQYNELSIDLKIRPFEELAYFQTDTEFVHKIDKLESKIFLPTKPSLQCQIIAQYIYLENRERKQMAKSRHEYLIEQVQYNRGDTITDNITNTKLHFAHPCEEFIWYVQLDRFIDGSLVNGKKQWYNYTIQPYEYKYKRKYKHKYSYGHTKKKKENNKNKFNDYYPSSTVLESQILLNGTNRITSTKVTNMIDSKYFNYVIPYQTYHHTPLPGTNVYSFALFPEYHQPSGSINMSKIDQAHLQILLDPRIIIRNENDLPKEQARVHIFTRNYNVLRILSGMAGLAFSC